MESNFYSDEFEQLIREKTEQYKMYPSEKVWKGIHGSLHTKRRWFITGMFLLITGILFLAGKELILPSGHGAAKKIAAGNNAVAAAPEKTDEDQTQAQEDFPTLHSGIAAAPGSKHNETSSGVPGTEDETFKGITITISDPVIRQPDLSEFLSKVVNLPSEAPSIPVVAARMNTRSDAGPASGNTANGLVNSTEKENSTESRTGGDNSLSASSQEDDNMIAQLNGVRGGSKGDEARIARMAKNKLGVSRTTKDPLVTSTNPDAAEEAARNPANKIPEAIDEQKVNWLQDYALYNLSPTPKRGRKYLEFTFSPTINYRTLSGGDFAPPKSYVQSVPVSSIHLGEAKDYVDHAPALGFELGGSVLYRVTRNLTFKAGLQFNFSRYKIQAYTSSPQQTTIPLNSYYGYYLDSITSVSTIRNFGGQTQETLNNDYYQLSAPVGFELRVLGNERLQLSLGATIQPSYLLNTNSYLLTTDYTNYTKVPSLFRRWNMNGGLQAFLSYKLSNGLHMQFGPEFRYQLLSTYDSQYPIQEHLKVFGLQFGIIRSF